MEMENEQIISIVIDWAEKENRIREVHLFGSRIEGVYNRNSNVDVAVRLHKAPSDHNEFLTWLHIADELSASLQKRLQVPVDLQWFNDVATPTMYSSVLQSSILVYQGPFDAERIAATCPAVML